MTGVNKKQRRGYLIVGKTKLDNFTFNLTRCTYHNLLKKMSRRFRSKRGVYICQTPITVCMTDRKTQVWGVFLESAFSSNGVTCTTLANNSTVDQMSVEAFWENVRSKGLPFLLRKRTQIVYTWQWSMSMLLTIARRCLAQGLIIVSVRPKAEEAFFRTLHKSKRDFSKKLEDQAEASSH